MQTWIQDSILQCQYQDQDPDIQDQSYKALLQRRNINCDSNLPPIRALIGLISNPL